MEVWSRRVCPKGEVSCARYTSWYSSAALPADVSNARTDQPQGERAGEPMRLPVPVVRTVTVDLKTNLLHKNREIRKSGAWLRPQP